MAATAFFRNGWGESEADRFAMRKEDGSRFKANFVRGFTSCCLFESFKIQK
jgi:hypothetical protein